MRTSLSVFFLGLSVLVGLPLEPSALAARALQSTSSTQETPKPPVNPRRTPPVLCAYQASDVFIPQNFDSNDRLRVFALIQFNHRSYKFDSPDIEVRDDRSIHIRTYALRPGSDRDMGTEVLSRPFQIEIPFKLDLTETKPEDFPIIYQVYLDADDFGNPQRHVGTLPVALATTATVDVTDYAPVTEVVRQDFMNPADDGVFLQGIFTDACMALLPTDISVTRTTDNLVEVIPNMKDYAAKRAATPDCATKTERRFSIPLQLRDELAKTGQTMPEGRFLLHVRITNGWYVNYVMDYFPHITR